MPAQGPIAPEVWGYDPKLKTEMSDFSRARAKALLDMHGYVDKQRRRLARAARRPAAGAGVLHQPDQVSRQLSELWKKNMDAIGIRDRVQDRQVAREPEGQPRRQAA